MYVGTYYMTCPSVCTSADLQVIQIFKDSFGFPSFVFVLERSQLVVPANKVDRTGADRDKVCALTNTFLQSDSELGFHIICQENGMC